jgi:proteasome accessory factor C
VSRPVAEHEVQRILALVPWLDAHPGATREEIAARFGRTVEQVDEDLDLVLMIGVPPYTPDAYIDVERVGDAVHLRLGDVFRRPLRLTPAEGVALLAAGRALLAVPGSDPEGPLATALAKLSAALGAADLHVDVGAAPFLPVVRAATERGEALELDYWSAGRDARTVRVVDPYAVFHAMGRWYLHAYCHDAGDERIFRVDRIRDARTTGRRTAATRPEAVVLPSGPVFHPDPADPRVTLDVPGEAAWIAETYPAESVEERPGGRRRIVLAVGEPAWLERLLLRLGPGVVVEDPPEWRERRRAVAARVRDRYR